MAFGIMDAVHYTSPPIVLIHQKNATLSVGTPVLVQIPENYVCHYSFDGSYPSRVLQGGHVTLDKVGLWHYKFIAFSPDNSNRSPLVERTFRVMEGWGCVINLLEPGEIQGPNLSLNLMHEIPRFSLGDEDVETLSGDDPHYITVRDFNVASVSFGAGEPSITVLLAGRITLPLSDMFLEANRVIRLRQAHTIFYVDGIEYHLLLYGPDCPLWDDIASARAKALLREQYGNEYHFHPRS